MQPRRFRDTARRVSGKTLGKDAAMIVDGYFRNGPDIGQIRVYRGRKPGESVISLGHFLIVSAATSRPDDAPADVEVIPVGAREVTHPSYGRYAQTGLRIAARAGQLVVPDLYPRKVQPHLGPEPIYPRGESAPSVSGSEALPASATAAAAARDILTVPIQLDVVGADEYIPGGIQRAQ